MYLQIFNTFLVHGVEPTMKNVPFLCTKRSINCAKVCHEYAIETELVIHRIRALKIHLNTCW